MTRLVCAEFDEFEEALYGVQGRYVLRARQQREWRLRIVDLNGVALMTGREGAGTLYTGIGLPGYFNIFVPLSAQESTMVDGTFLGRRKLGWMAPDVMFHIDASRPGSWLTVAMSHEIVMDWARTHPDEFDFSMVGRNLVSDACTDLASLIRLARRLFQVDSLDPEQLHAAAAEHAARVEILDAVFRALLPIESRRDSPRRGLDRKRILERALGLLESVDTVSFTTDDLCAATGASERTVRNVFHDYLGMSPHRYLMLHRLHAIRSALRKAQPGETVTNVCARFGVWDFGRFAQQHHRIFGTLPSEVLAGRRRSHARGAAARLTSAS